MATTGEYQALRTSPSALGFSRGATVSSSAADRGHVFDTGKAIYLCENPACLAHGVADCAVHVTADRRLHVLLGSVEVICDPLKFMEVTTARSADGESISLRLGMLTRHRLDGLSYECAAAVSKALRTLVDRGTLARVAYEQLESEPAAFHGRLIESQGPWEQGFERSRFAGAWLSRQVRGGSTPASGAPVLVRGLRLARPGACSGHLGACSAELIAYNVVPTADPTA